MSTPFLTLVALTCILACIIIFMGGVFIAGGSAFLGFALLGLGTGWIGILHASILRVAASVVQHKEE